MVIDKIEGERLEALLHSFAGGGARMASEGRDNHETDGGSTRVSGSRQAAQ
jgi:hypothetical protein